MAAIPVDPARVNFLLAADTCEAAPAYSEADASGQRSRIDGRQAVDRETGLPIHVIYVLTAVEAGERPSVEKVKVVSPVPPVLGPAFTPVRLTDLVAVPYVSNGRVSISWKCTGVDVLVAPGTKPGTPFGDNKDSKAA